MTKESLAMSVKSESFGKLRLAVGVRSCYLWKVHSCQKRFAVPCVSVERSQLRPLEIRI